jgi:hypothetical protein
MAAPSVEFAAGRNAPPHYPITYARLRYRAVNLSAFGARAAAAGGEQSVLDCDVHAPNPVATMLAITRQM